MRSDALSLAIKTAGGPAALARKLNIAPQAVSQWEQIPPGRVVEIHRITGLSLDVLAPRSDEQAPA